MTLSPKMFGGICLFFLAFVAATAAEAQVACNGNGTLNSSGQCVCFAGFIGASCEYSRFTTCSGHGNPTGTGGCFCDTGFAGANCSSCDANYYNYPTCRFCNAATTCGGHGVCNSFGTCTCQSGFGGSSCSSCQADYYNYPTCQYCNAAITCNGQGTCTSAGTCDCQPGFTGPGCDVPVAPAITCLNPRVRVPSTADTCTACPTPAQIFSVQDPSANCTVSPACPYTPGTTSVRVACTSPTGGSSAASCPLLVDESLPQLQCPDVTVACTGVLPESPQGTSVCSAAATTCLLNTGTPWVAGAGLAGAVSYSCEATTPGGTASCGGLLRTTDLGPTITPELGPINLWPANHKMQAFELSDCVSSAVDACTGQPIDIDTHGRIVRVTSDEAQDAPESGDGQTCGDIQITSPTSVQLRRERNGSGNGRVYTVYYEVSNGRGAVTAGSCQIGTPHSANSASPVADASQYCVGQGCPVQAACTAPKE